jgi:hypothetical protein
MNELVKFPIIINIVAIPLSFALAPIMIEQMNGIADSVAWGLDDTDKQKINDMKKTYVILFYVFPPAFVNGLILGLMFSMHILTREKIDKKAQYIDNG